jgi:hypothetical protein
MNEPEEIKPEGTEQEAQQAAPMEAPEPGVGDLMKEGTRKAIAALVVLLLIVAYLGGLAYAEVHGLNMLRAGVAPDLLMWAYIGMVSLGVLAIALPLSLHYWAFDPTHRLATFICYGLDLALLGVNSFTDFNTNEGQQLVQWAQFYKDYIVPATPVIAMLMATVLLLLDPRVKALVMRQALRAAMMQQQANLIMKEANNQQVNATIRAAAAQEVESTLTELFGRPVTSVKGYTMDGSQPARRSLLSSFFGRLYERGMQALTSAMLGQSQPSASEDPNEPPQP